jgi:hypothetical protein
MTYWLSYNWKDVVWLEKEVPMSSLYMGKTVFRFEEERTLQTISYGPPATVSSPQRITSEVDWALDKLLNSKPL